MNASQTTTPPRRLGRRRFLAASAALGTTAALAPAVLGAAANTNSRLRILQIGAGGIGGLDRQGVKDHPRVEFAGFCDVDRQALDRVAAEFPGAFTVADYREAFAERADEFDAVIVDTPDFHHAPMMITALKHGKHVYGQKPLVHQLDEIRMLRDVLARRPGLVTQMGNQRASVTGRMQAVEMLRRNQLGRPVEAHVWTGAVQRDSHFAAPWSPVPEPQPVPGHIDWDLWNGPLTTRLPYSTDLAPKRWRAFWETGGGQLADWGCHLVDVLYYAYDLPSPRAVQTNTIRAAGTGHSAYNQSTITYPGGERFAGDTFVVRYNDSVIRPSFAAIGLPPMRPGVNHTLIVCEEGALLLGDLGKIDVYRGGRRVDEARPDVEPCDHWKDWVDRCLGAKKPVWSPFSMALRITEPSLLAVKATRYPGEELRWDGDACRFTNHDGANRDILGREYREGFGPPEVTP